MARHESRGGGSPLAAGEGVLWTTRRRWGAASRVRVPRGGPSGHDGAVPAEGDLSDPELVRRLADGDREVRHAAFEALHRRHARRSFQLAFRVLRDADLAADAVQEAFLSVLRKGARFEERAQFSSWLFRVVLNRSIDIRRRERRVATETDASPRGKGGAPEEPEPGGKSGASAVEEPPDAVQSAERAAAVHAAIRRLSPKLEEIVLLRYPEGLSYEEIGDVLGLPPGTVRSRLNRAHAALRELLGPALDEDAENP